MRRLGRQVCRIETLEPRLLLSGAAPLVEAFDDATPIDYAPAEQVIVSGAVADGPGRMYRFSPETKGRVRLDLVAEADALDPRLVAYKKPKPGKTLDSNDDASTGTDSARLAFKVKPGRTYYVLAGAADGAGDFEMTLTSRPRDDHAGVRAAAEMQKFKSRRNKTKLKGKIDFRGDVDVLAIVAPETGRLHTQAKIKGKKRTPLTCEMTVLDADGAVVVRDGGDGDLDAALTGGRTYYIRIAAQGEGIGKYKLKGVLEAQPVPAPMPDEPLPPPMPDDPAPAPPAPPAPQGGVTVEAIHDGGLYVLRVLGTDEADDITVRRSGDRTVVLSGDGTDRMTGDFDGVWIYGFAGGDVLRVENSVAADVVLYGGEGADRLFEAGAGSAVLRGEGGDDLLVALGGGTDELHGGVGMDSLWCDGADGLADAELGEYAAGAVHRVSAFYQPYTDNPDGSRYVPLDVARQNLTDPDVTWSANGYAGFADMPLFADGPTYDDIDQGAIGDCYFLAALSSLSESDPRVIREAIAPLGDGTFAVRFHRDGQAVYVRVDADLPVRSGGGLAYAGLSPTGEIWVPLMEKAYAHFRRGENSYASLSMGWMSTVYREVTNGWTASRTVGVDGEALAAYLQGHFDAGHAVTVGSRSDAGWPIVGQHAYVVRSVQQAGADYHVTVYNPWARDGVYYDDNPGDGLLTITMDTLLANFSSVAVSLA